MITDREGHSFEGPAYAIEGLDAEVRLWPITGEKVGLAVMENGEEVHTDAIERGFWRRSNRREQIAAQVGRALGGDVARDHARTAISQMDRDEGKEQFEASMRTSRERAIRARTEGVILWTGEGGKREPEWVVTIQPPSGHPTSSSLDLVLTPEQMVDGSDHLNRRHYEVFGDRIEIDSVEWDGLTSYWSEMQVVRDGERP